MKRALDLSEEFFNDVVLTGLMRRYPDHWQRIAVGLTGNGSECFGFDDEYSQDHDWGVELFFWLCDEDYQHLGDDLATWIDSVKAAHPEYPFRKLSPYGIRKTVYATSDYYSRIIGFPRAPQLISEWRAVPEDHLAMAVNGRVFQDELGEFSAIRSCLKGYYPEDLRMKKLAARCLRLAQTGQYNYGRCAKRKHTVSKELTLGKFVSNAISMTFLINRRFMPYYKWAYMLMETLPLLGSEIAGGLRDLYGTRPLAADACDSTCRESFENLDEIDLFRIECMESICQIFIKELRDEGLTNSTSTFLVQHGEEIQGRIQDPYLKAIPTQYE